MRIAITGATGFVGASLAPALIADGHTVVALVRPRRDRDPAALSERLGGAEVRTYDALDVAATRAALEGCEAVINLAGESVLGGRWTRAFLARIHTSRIDTTRTLVAAMGELSPPPRVLLSASAVGIYGACVPHDVRTEETATLGHDVLAELCKAWEAAALGAEAHGTRVVLLRIGVVLGRGGGALAQLETPFKLGLGGRIGSGEQVMSWVHIDDVVALARFALAQSSVHGAINVTAPEPVSNAELTQTLARQLRRPALVPVPTLALRLLFGGGAFVLTTGQRVHPRAALDAGFRFAHPRLAGALAAIYGER